MKNLLIFVVVIAFCCPVLAQGQKPAQPQIRVNYLNVCSPSEAEKSEIAATLDKLPAKPHFATDFEIARGRTTMDENSVVAGVGAKMSGQPAEVSSWVRIRKEFPEASPYSNVQYSFSVTGESTVETLVFRMREPRDVMQVSISDTVTAAADPAQVVAAGTPADRVRLERFGKSSLVLARCKDSDQSTYESLFRKASDLMSLYREVLGARRIVPQELPKGSASPKTTPGPSKRKPAH